MDCEHVREQILESFEGPESAPQAREIAAHLAGCAACTAFAAKQHALDARLTAMFTPAEPSAAFRQVLHARKRREAVPSWHDSLPDIVHFASCGIATLWSVIALPFDPVTVAGVGITAAFASYALLTIMRRPFEDAELLDQ